MALSPLEVLQAAGWLDSEAAAQYVGTTRRYLLSLARKGRIPTGNLLGLLFFHVTDLDHLQRDHPQLGSRFTSTAA